MRLLVAKVRGEGPRWRWRDAAPCLLRARARRLAADAARRRQRGAAVSRRQRQRQQRAAAAPQQQARSVPATRARRAGLTRGARARGWPDPALRAPHAHGGRRAGSAAGVCRRLRPPVAGRACRIGLQRAMSAAQERLLDAISYPSAAPLAARNIAADGPVRGERRARAFGVCFNDKAASLIAPRHVRGWNVAGRSPVASSGATGGAGAPVAAGAPGRR